MNNCCLNNCCLFLTLIIKSAIENISPSVIKRISKEINALVAQPPEGIKVIVNESDVCDVQAWIYGPGNLF